MEYDFEYTFTATGVYATDQGVISGIPALGETGAAASIVAGAPAGQMRVQGLTGMIAGYVGKRMLVQGADSAANNGWFEIAAVNSDTEVDLINASAVIPDANNGSISWDLGDISIKVNLKEGSGGIAFELDDSGTPAPPVFYDARSTIGSAGTTINKSFFIKGTNLAKTKIHGGKQPFLVQDIGTKHDFHVEDIYFVDTWMMPVHLRRMRHGTILLCDLDAETAIGRGVPPKVFNGQSEQEFWGFKAGCYNFEDGPNGKVRIEQCNINLHAGAYAGTGEENCASKGIQVMVCPPTCRIIIKNNSVKGAALRGISVVDHRGFVQVHGNIVDMNAPFLHKGSLSEYHNQGAVSGSGITISNGYSFVHEPIDKGEVDYYKNVVTVRQKDMVGVQIAGRRPSDVGPLSIRKNHFTMVGDASNRPLAGILFQGMDYASLSGNTFAGNAQIGMLIGCVTSVYEFGTKGNSFDNVFKDLAIDHGVMAFIGADGQSNTLVGKGLPTETLQFPVDAELVAQNDLNHTPGYALVIGDVAAGVAAILSDLNTKGIGYN